LPHAFCLPELDPVQVANGLVALDRVEGWGPHSRIERREAGVLVAGIQVKVGGLYPVNNVTIYVTLHLWHNEPGTTATKAIAGAIRKAIQLDAGRRVDLRFESGRFIRDPDRLSHGVVILEEGAL
jgi:hypothetical protein